ncbi:MAG: selenide, water dikinase SelD [Saprospiraceae bacterium]|nr:selenide, water dikinase SelD [Saprospiraceae bacterium]
MERSLLEFRLTQYSHGAGCGCKIAPSVLDKILLQTSAKAHFPQLLVGNNERDDAAVFDLGDGTAIVSTTDFFMPIVDDAKDFGRIAAANAISDIYAMGASPIMAIAILGWPVDKIPAEVAAMVLEGGREICQSAGIPLAGGHSIDCPEPIFGLAVTGRGEVKNIKKNGGAAPGCKIFLTKPLGVGILSTAQKKEELLPEHTGLARDNMVGLNDIGVVFGSQKYIKAMTDVTGFGLLGHLSEMCEASGVTAVIKSDKVPVLNQSALDYYLSKKCIPGGTVRNWASYGHKINDITAKQKNILCDPQTSGGLLVAVAPQEEQNFIALTRKYGLKLTAFGHFESLGTELIRVL